MKKNILLLIIMSCFAIMRISGQTVIDPEKGFTLQNEYVQYIFEPGGLGLSGMIDKKTGFNHIRNVEGKHLLWEITFGKGTQRPHIDNNYKNCSCIKLYKKPNGDQIAEFQWNDMRFWEEDSIVNVRVTVELSASDGIAKWRIFVRNLSTYWGLWDVSCPSVNGFPADGIYDLAMPVTASGGRLMKRWSGSFVTRSPSGFFPMQFMSFNSGNNAVYFSSMDGTLWAKDFNVNSKKETLSLIRYPENMGVTGSDLHDHYAVAFGPYQGDWLQAAYRYRDWAMQQKWTQLGPISQRPDFPKSILNIGFWIRDTWVWDVDTVKRKVLSPLLWSQEIRDPHEMNLPFLKVIKEMGVPVAMQWYGWNTKRFDNGYPHFLPALSGFSERVRELVDSGALIVPYINGHSADSKISDWKENFDSYAIKDEEGGLRQHFYWDGAGRLTPMCPGQVPWQHTISSLIDKMINLFGINGIYVDEVSCNSHELCFNPDHHHTLGGGHYWAEGYRNYYQEVLNVAHKNNRNIVVTSEGSNEIFFDLVHGNLYTGRPSENEIPLQEIVYSGYTLFYGTVCDYTKSNRYFNFAVGQGFIDGRQIGWMDFGLFRNPQYAEKVQYLKQCAKLRMVTQKYLTFGRLWAPVYPTNNIPTFEEDFEERGSAGHKGSVPSAEARLWQAEDGHLAVFIANYTDKEIPFSYMIDPAKYGLTADRFEIAEITAEKIIPVTKSGRPIKRTENMPPNKVRVIEITPAR